MRKKLLIISSIVLIGVSTLIYFNPFSKSEIIILNHLSENTNKYVDQICLVDNPPSTSKALYEMIKEFDLNHKSSDKNYKRLYIKQHDYIFLPAFTLRDNIDYTSPHITRNDLDNIDFLGSSFSYLSKDGRKLKDIKVNTGEIWYYKK